MKQVSQNYQILEQFAVRTPLLPLNKLKSLYVSGNFKTELLEIFQESHISEAVYLSSPELHDRINNLNWSDSSTNHHKLVLSLLKYITRICSRATPFGLFGGTSIGEFGEETSLVLNPIDKYRRKTRFDFEFMSSFVKRTLSYEIVIENILFYPNTTLYAIGGKLRYIEVDNSGSSKEYILQDTIVHGPILEVLDFAKKGVLVKEIHHFLETLEFEKEEITEFIKLLIKNQILVSSLEPYSTGPNYDDYIISELSSFDNLKEAQFLRLGKSTINQLDLCIGNDLTNYNTIEKKALEFNTDLDRAHLFQTDLFPNLQSAGLNRKVKISLSRALNVLAKVSQDFSSPNLENFKKAFFKRYETKEVPLVVALDLDNGLGYPLNKNSSIYPYLDELKIRHVNLIEMDEATLNSFQRFIMPKIQNLKDKSIELSDSDLSEIKMKEFRLSASSYIFTELIGNENNLQFFIKYIGGSSASNLIGRFSGGSQEINEFVKRIHSLESTYYEDSIVAEISHIPENRTGNILLKPQTRVYQINFLSGYVDQNCSSIPISDLLIGCDNDRLYIKSKTLDKEVIPYLSNAHNYKTSTLPIYRFLCDLQFRDSSPGLAFDWGILEKMFSHLPRLFYKDIIIAKEQWRFNTKELLKDLRRDEPDKMLMSAISTWKEEMSIPRYIQLGQGDNMLLIDLDNPFSVRMMLNTIQKLDYCIFYEFLFENESLITNLEGETYVNEFIFAMTRKKTANGN